jgi:hypothetical protein
MKLSLPILFFAASLCACARADEQAASAEQQNTERNLPDAASKKFDALDRNHDRHISVEEARSDPSLEKRFASADANGDRLLDEAEFRAKGE